MALSSFFKFKNPCYFLCSLSGQRIEKILYRAFSIRCSIESNDPAHKKYVNLHVNFCQVAFMNNLGGLAIIETCPKIKDLAGNKVTTPQRIAEIKQWLLDAIEEYWKAG